MPSWGTSNSVWRDWGRPKARQPCIPSCLPYPITQYDIVYTKRRSFDAICKKLVQIHIPMFADEKVYAMIREIKFLRPEEFEPIIPMLGAWHAE